MNFMMSTFEIYILYSIYNILGDEIKVAAGLRNVVSSYRGEKFLQSFFFF